MHVKSLTPVLLAAAWQLVCATADNATDELLPRAIGSKCTGVLGNGLCQPTAKCKGISYLEPFCPDDPYDIQCCVEIPCNVGSKSGYCRSVSNNGCPGGKFDPGNYCPGPQDIQCCLKDGGGSTPDPPNPPTGGDVGQKVLAKAMTAAGLPYAWGGGSCSGPTRDSKGPNGEPWDHGEIGFDCSGLVCWAVCQVTGRDLFAEGLRNTAAMYCASDAKRKYQKIPLAQRRAGDAIFWGGRCDCGAWGTIHHVGLMMDSGNRVWNAPNDDINKVKEMKISDFGEEPCPYVIRFT